MKSSFEKMRAKAERIGRKRARDEKIVKMRAQGWSPDEIEDSLGVGYGTVHRVWSAHRKRLENRDFSDRKVDEFEAVDSALNQLQSNLFRHVYGATGCDARTQVLAANAVVKVIAAKRALFQLDAPERIEIVNAPRQVDVTLDAIRERVKAQPGSVLCVLRLALAYRHATTALGEGAESAALMAEVDRTRPGLRDEYNARFVAAAEGWQWPESPANCEAEVQNEVGFHA